MIKKRLMKVIMVFTIALSAMTFTGISNKAEAASYGSWETIYGSCKARVVTDAYSYKKTATTIDVYGETNGSCSKTLNYNLWLDQPAAGQVGPQSFSGSFNNQSPTKKFTISRLNLDSWHSNPTTLIVTMDITNYSNYLTNNINVYH